MDIGMSYGNHSTHTSGFQSPDLGTGGYPYFTGHHHHHHSHAQAHHGYQSNPAPSSAPPASSNFNSTAHPHLYSPSALEYGITTSSNNSPSEFFEASDAYYSASGTANNGLGSPGVLPENHIISSDNGLSYTNLDYITYQQTHGNQGFMMQNSVDEKVHLAHHYEPHQELMMANSQLHSHHHSGPASWHHHHPGYMDSPPHQIGLNGLNNIASMQASSLQAQQINHQMHSPSGIQSAQSTSPSLSQQQQQLQQQNVPTYKWMQVKRNVPKPQSE